MWTFLTILVNTGIQRIIIWRAEINGLPTAISMWELVSTNKDLFIHLTHKQISINTKLRIYIKGVR